MVLCILYSCKISACGPGPSFAPGQMLWLWEFECNLKQIRTMHTYTVKPYVNKPSCNDVDSQRFVYVALLVCMCQWLQLN